MHERTDEKAKQALVLKSRKGDKFRSKHSGADFFRGIFIVFSHLTL